AADHSCDETAVVELAQRCGDNPLPVAKDGRRVADLVDLLEVVRDVEDGDAARLDTPNTVEEALDRAALERRGRLVEDQKARADRECARDLDDLLLLDRELRDGLVDVEVEAPLEQQPARLPAQLVPVDEPLPAAAEEDVLADAQ